MAAVARQGDAGVSHCSGFTIAQGSSSVFINGRPAARVGDSNTSHLKPAGRFCLPHTASISTGSASVKCNGRPLARVGSSFSGCTAVAQGSPNVFVGD